MIDATGQERLVPRQAADSSRDGRTVTNPNPVAPEVSATSPDVLLAQMVLDEVPDLPPLPPQFGAAIDDPKLQGVLATGAEAPFATTAGSRATGGGGSRYDSDFGEVIASLEASETANIATPVPLAFARLLTDDTEVTFSVALPAVVPGTPGSGSSRSSNTDGAAGSVIAGSDGDDTGLGGDDSSSGSDNTGFDGEDTDAGPGGTPAGPGADQALFTGHADTVDFTLIDAGGYLDGTQYSAGNGDDIVILPANAEEALAAGFAEGTLFVAENGNDQVIGGDLADAIDGGNSHDLLIGGGGDDTLFGGNGLDTLYGGDGDDSLSGGGDNGKDWLNGGAGNDTLSGGNGKDILIGSLGDDSLIGGLGRDDFVYSLTTDEGNDTITDFQSGKGGDTLVIDDVTDVNGDGKIDIADLDASGSLSGTATGIVITFDSGTSIALADLGGTGIASFADLVSQAKVNVDFA